MSLGIQKLTLLRLQKQQAQLEKQPIPNALVYREDILKFHFCLYDLEGPYEGGLYHGLFDLHQNYPFNAPKLYFYTPSGRFEINLPICTSFTNYHQETWTSAWNVRSLILATISFMYSEQPSYGCRSDPEVTRKLMAKESKEYNFNKTPDFCKFFGSKLLLKGKITQREYDRWSKRCGLEEAINKSETDQKLSSQVEVVPEADFEGQDISKGLIGRGNHQIEEKIERKNEKQRPQDNRWRTLKIVGVSLLFVACGYIVFKIV